MAGSYEIECNVLDDDDNSHFSLVGLEDSVVEADALEKNNDYADNNDTNHVSSAAKYTTGLEPTRSIRQLDRL